MALQWDDVRLFLALMQARSLTRAAKELGIDISTMSRRLTAFEEALGATLFVRSREGVRPTAAAEELVPDAETMAEAAGRLARVSEGLEVAPEGVVRLTAPPTVVETMVMPLVPRLVKTWPKLSLEVVSSQAVLDLSRREADLAIRTMKPTSGELIVVKLLEVPYGLFAARALAKRLGKLGTLAEVPVVSWTLDASVIPAARWMNEHAARAQFVVRTNSLGGQLEAVRHGVGVGLLPARVASSVAGLVPLDLRSAPPFPADVLWLVGHQALRRVPRVQAVWEFLREAAETDARES